MARWLALLLPGVWWGIGCQPPCSTEGTEGLSGFDMDCDDVQFLGSEDVLTLSIVDSSDGQIDLEMFNVITLGPGLRFGKDGDYTLEGRYFDSTTAIADVDAAWTWVEIDDWEPVEEEAYGQRVAFSFFVEVEPASTFTGGTLEGSATGVPVFTVE